MPDITDQDGYIVCAHSPFEEFVGSLISHVRQMGPAWHGMNLNSRSKESSASLW